MRTRGTFSGHDRGHMVPSADMRWSLDALKATYLYSNISPQRPELNRGAWADLEDWMSAVEASALPALHAFARGLRKVQPAVIAGLSTPYSNGPIEGANTKVKLLKRQMYGRAGFPMLRQRILLS